MMCLRSCRPSHSSLSANLTMQRVLLAIAAAVLVTTVSAQNSSQADSHSPAAQASPNSTITIPPGTRVALVLTHPIQSRYIHHGDDIYAQITSPVNSGNQMVIPPGTLIDGKVDRLVQNHGRGEIHLQGISITFSDGYVAPIEGPITIESNEGYAMKDPGPRRATAAFAMPLAGAGLGALIGHSVGKADSSVTTPFPPGCTGLPPFCTTTTTPVFGTKTKDAIIGASIGGGVGFIASITTLFSSRHFFMDVGSPVEMTLERPVILDENEVAQAVDQSTRQPFAQQPVLPRPIMVPPPPVNPGTPPVVIPGTPGPDGVPGPPTVIPGTPPGN